MAYDIPISGEFCTFTIEGVALAATRTFTLNIDRANFGNFVARGTDLWRTNYMADIGWTQEFDGLIVVQDTSPTKKQFDDLFTYMANRTQLTIVFTLRTNTSGEKTFIYTGEAFLTALSASAPQFGESTYTGSLLGTGALAQTTGTVS